MSKNDALSAATREFETDLRTRFVAYLDEIKDSCKEFDQASFSRMIRLAHVFLSPGAFSSEFGVTLSTVDRWASDDSLPSEYLIQRIVGWLAKSLREPVPA